MTTCGACQHWGGTASDRGQHDCWRSCLAKLSSLPKCVRAQPVRELMRCDDAAPCDRYIEAAPC